MRKQVERESERSGGINRCLYMLWRVQAQQENKSEGGAAEMGGETVTPHCQAIMERTKEKRCPVQLLKILTWEHQGIVCNF